MLSLRLLTCVQVEAPLTLLTLPADMMQRILEYLLLAKEVAIDQPPAYKSYPKYRLEVQILRTCKLLHTEGSKVLRRNHFVVFSVYYKALSDHISWQPMCVWDQNLAGFKAYSLRVHIGLGKGSDAPKSKKSHFFMICLLDLERCIRCVKMLAHMASPRFSYKFVVGEGLSHKVQNTLLSPFEYLAFQEQKCEVQGDVDPAIASRIVKAITPDFTWIRAKHYDFMRLCDLKLEDAESVYNAGNITASQAMFGILMDNYSSSTAQEIACTDDRILILRLAVASRRAIYGWTLANLILALNCAQLSTAKQFFIKMQGAFGTAVTMELAPQLSTLDGCLGIAFWFLGRSQSGVSPRELFESGIARDPGHPLCTVALQILQSPYSRGLSATEWTRRSKLLETAVPKRLVSPDIPASYLGPSSLPGLDQELYTLDRVGYHGDRLEGQLVQRKGWCVTAYDRVKGTGVACPKRLNRPFRTEDVDASLVTIFEKLAECKKAGIRPPPVVIGPNVYGLDQLDPKRNWLGDAVQNTM